MHSVNFAAKLVQTRCALSSAIINSLQEPVSGQACNPLDPHLFFLSFSRWKSFTVLGTKVAPFPYLMWGMVFTACVVYSFLFCVREHYTVKVQRGQVFRVRVATSVCWQWETSFQRILPACLLSMVCKSACLTEMEGKVISKQHGFYSKPSIMLSMSFK